jgi:meiotically up-regulated gene 157 (Mug157) protein
MMLLNLVLSLIWTASAQCPDYVQYYAAQHLPFSSGRYQLSYQRPDPSCRTLILPEVEATINNTLSKIADPDLQRLFENTFPNTLDTAIRWRGTAAGSDEELAFIITGDINAMWLRDSANQMQSYLPLLTSANSTLASLFRGVINLQARYIIRNPYCNSFQPPLESGIPPTTDGLGATDTVTPPYDINFVFECKYELDSLAAFLQISTQYYDATGDLDFFSRYRWVEAVQAVLSAADAMQFSTYAPDGHVNKSPYTWLRKSDRATETQANDGEGSPVGDLSGLIRSFFRPSDDSTIYQGFIPANMMFSRYLYSASQIMAQLPNQGSADLAQQMQSVSKAIHMGIDRIGVFQSRIYAFEVDGFSSYNIMDDANVPSLLSAPLIGYTTTADPIYQNTRALILSAGNPYFMRGPVINAIGGPHIGPGYAWPMASIVRILTSEDDAEIVPVLRELLSSTDGLGLIHESINTFNATDYTRPWYVTSILIR